MLKSFVIAIVVLMVGLIGWNIVNGRGPLQFSTPPLTNPYQEKSPYHADRAVFLQRLSQSSKVNARFSQTLATRGHLAALPLTMQRATLAIKPELLWKMTNVLMLALPLMPEKSCAAVLRLPSPYDDRLGKDFVSALEKMPPEHHKVAMDFYFDALQAEVDDQQGQKIDVESFSAATATLAGLYADQRQLLGTALNDPNSLSDQQACTAIKQLLSGIGQMKQQHTEALVRKLWAPK